MRTTYLLSAIVIFIVSLSFSQTLPEKSTALVNDYANVLTTQQQVDLEKSLDGYWQRTTIQIAVVTIPNLNGFSSIEEYANALFHKWGIGEKGKDDGVLIINSIAEHKIRIEVGYGLEGILTDLQSGQIISAMKPYLKKSDYMSAYYTGIHGLMITLGDLTPDEAKAKKHYEQARLDSLSAVEKAQPTDGTADTFLLVLAILIVVASLIGAIYIIIDTPNRRKRNTLAAENMSNRNLAYYSGNKVVAQNRSAEVPDDSLATGIILGAALSSRNDDDDNQSSRSSDDSPSSPSSDDSSGFGGFGGGDSGGAGASGDY